MTHLPRIFRRRPGLGHRRAICELMTEGLQTLPRMVRAAEITQLAQRVCKRESDPQFFSGLTKPRQQASVVLHLRAIVETLRTESDAVLARFRAAETQLDRATNPREQKRVLGQYLTTTGHNWREIRRDVAALDRDFGVDVLRERTDAELKHQDDLEELALAAMGGLLDGIEGVDVEPAKVLLIGAELPRFLVDAVIRDDHWRIRAGAARALASLVALVGDDSELAPLLKVAQDRSEHPWVQSEVVEALLRASPDSALDVVRSRLLDPIPHHHERDFLARRLIVDLLARHAPRGSDILEALIDGHDPSEHVRVGTCLALARLGHEPPRLTQWEQLCRPAPGGGENSRAVRGQAIALLVPMLGDLLGKPSDPAGTNARRTLVGLVGSVLATETDPVVLQVCADECSALAGLVPEECREEIRELLSPVLSALDELARGSKPAEVVESAAAARECLVIALDPRLSRTLRALEANVQGAPVGKTRTLPQDPIAPPEIVGRILAALSQNDFGLDGTLRGKGIRITRGSRFRRRAWRILHEMRNRAPNKRQGALHTIGRSFSGEIRAHSGRLHEATATAVPGEPVHIEAAGGWGRHLPTVDDVVSLPILSKETIRIFSSHGIAEVVPPPSVWKRVWSRVVTTLSYAQLDRLRRQSLESREPQERSRFVREVRERCGVQLQFRAFESSSEKKPARASPRVEELFDPSSSQTHRAWMVPILFPSETWLRLHSHYFLSLEGNSQTALAYFGAAVLATFAGTSYLRRRTIRAARQQIPLCIGGWGTRGKSGTERLKAALFHGLGCDVFSKTTGCEAMFLHSAPRGELAEIFSYRPKGKATIWEQVSLLVMAAEMKVGVFLWECMALNSRYVGILQRAWMQDDYSTITNAYPDHEDIQGPTGTDVAQTIAQFIPTRGFLINSEKNFLPLFQEVCREKRTQIRSLGDHDEEFLPRDLLDLFPYDEHPRNILLVATLADELGIDRSLAITLMADHVVPDIGVLKTYPRVVFLGRSLQFTNGCSANERTGFLTSWRRSGFDDVSTDEDPRRFIMTVVNNRDDRVSRSEVFARILVEDVAADQHILIGTNLSGLQRYMEQAMERFIQMQVILRPRDTTTADGRDRAHQRLADLLRRVRIPAQGWTGVLNRLRVYAKAAGYTVVSEAKLERGYKMGRLTLDDKISLDAVSHRLRDRARWSELFRASLEPSDESTRPGPEVYAEATLDDVLEHGLATAARAGVYEALQARVQAALEGQLDCEPVNEQIRTVYRELFFASVMTLDDPKATGDWIVERCARAAPPGTDVRIMGTQNIKGTGLDFVYRWLAVDTVIEQLQTADHGTVRERTRALAALLAFEDHGVMDLGLLAHRCRTPATADDGELFARLQAKVEQEVSRRTALMKSRRPAGITARLIHWAEPWLDAVHGISRHRRAHQVMRDLAHARISHPRAAARMRRINDEDKGGWLLRALTPRGSRSDEG